MHYAKRVMDELLDTVQPHLPALVLQGPKAVGKTATCQRRARTVFRMDRPDEQEILRANRDRLTELPGPVFIDEWQQYPPAWDFVRQAVDAGAAPGQFLLAGSAAPSQAPIHSGAGRLVTLRMRPLSLAERGLADPAYSLRALLDGHAVPVTASTSVRLTDYADEVTRSGFPGIRSLAPIARGFALKAYIDAVVQREFPEQGLAVRRPETLRGWLRAYAAATATTASYRTILEAATPAEADKPARSTTLAYRDVLDQLWLLDPLPAWLPQDNRFTRLASSPKHFLADPALAASLLDLGPAELLTSQDGLPDVPRPQPLLGALFEHLMALSVLVYADACDARVSHFRALDGGREVDLIVERGRTVVAIEVKLAGQASARDFAHLRWLRERLGDRLAAGIVVTTGTTGYQREDGFIVIPAALLGP